MDDYHGIALFDTIFSSLDGPSDSITVTLPNGEQLAFRTIRGRKALASIRRAAHSFAESVTELNCPAEMQPYMTSDRETLVWVHLLGHLCLDGEASDFLKLQHIGPVLFDYILVRVQAALTGALDLEELDRISEAKKGLAPIASGATGSS